MKLAICANHSYPHVGGVEKIVSLIAESMVQLHDMQVDVLSCSLKEHIEYNGVHYRPCPSGISFISQMKKIAYDHLFVYSDFFKYWPILLDHVNVLDCKKSIALVGMYFTTTRSQYLQKLIQNKDKIKLITHSDDYDDYTFCKAVGLNPTVINNGVKLSEFEDNKVDFRLKYQIPKDIPILLCVSNFFPGKGQDDLVGSLRKLNQINNKFMPVFISSTVNFPYAKMMSEKCEKLLKSINKDYRFLVDISREDTVAAFNASDIFTTASSKEVAPVCILEAMASRTPWVALDVGNVKKLSGGFISPSKHKDINGYWQFTDDVSRDFANNINLLLTEKNIHNQKQKDGYSLIQRLYNWETIQEQYYQIFNDEE